MKFKVTPNQLEGLHLLIRIGRTQRKPQNMPDKLVDTLMGKLEERLEKKVAKIWTDSSQPKSITLNEIEAMTLYCWYNNMRTYMEHDYQYEVIVADRIFNQIDQQYA